MKDISKKVLVWLYPVAQEKRWLPRTELDLLLPRHRPKSRRSLLRLLAQQRLISSQTHQGESWVRITQPGRELVNRLFWAQLEQPSVTAGWQVIVFKTPPPADPGFRRLRRLVLRHKAGQLASGVYLLPGKLPPALTRTLLDDYSGNVVVVESSDFSFGDPDSVIEEIFMLQDVAEAYSGVSTELSQLIVEKGQNKGLTDQQKRQLYLVFDRFWEIFCGDTGLLVRYSNLESRGRQCLVLFNQLSNYEDI